MTGPSSACGRCQMRLSPEPTRTSAPFGEERVCPHCEWVNTYSVRSRIEIDLRAARTALPSAFAGLPEVDQCASAEAWARALRDRLIKLVGEEVAADRAQAVTWLLGMLDDLRGRNERFGFDDSPIQALQFVYFHFLASGAVPVFAEPARGFSAFWEDGIVVASRIEHLLAEALREIQLGARLSVTDEGITVVDESPVADWARDVNANLLAGPTPSWPQMVEVMRDPLAVDAERLAFGVSVADLLEVVTDVEGLRRQTRVVDGPGFFIVDLGPQAPDGLRDMVWRLVLTRRRLSQQVAPDFLCAPDAPVLRGTREAFAEAAWFDWLKFAPLMLGTYGTGDDLHPAAILSPYLVSRACSKAYTGVSRRLAAAEQETRRSGADSHAQVARLRRAFHQRLEHRVAEILVEAGFDTVESLDALDGRSLECGEIDVLAALHGSHRVVVVCEAKDTDISFFKDAGPSETHEVAVHAHRQVTRKATWVLEHWAQLAPLFGPTPPDAAPPVVVGLSVPRAASLPLGTGPASIPLQSLPEIAASLAFSPPRLWRLDLQHAIVRRTGMQGPPRTGLATAGG